MSPLPCRSCTHREWCRIEQIDCADLREWKATEEARDECTCSDCRPPAYIPRPYDRDAA